MTTNSKRRHLLQVTLGAIALPGWTIALAADKYPARPVKLIVPLPPGGVVDNAARAVVNTMQPSFGQPIVIDNKPAGTFQVAMNTIKSAPTDGYTLLFVHAAMLATQAVFQRYDLFKQFVPVVGMGQTDITFVVSGKKPYKTIQELIDYGRANPGKLSYVSPGAGTLEHLALANLCQRYGIDAVHVPLKGSVEVVKALIQGEGDFSTLAVPLVQQFGAKGMVRALVVLNEKRNAAIPDVPTYKEEKLDVPRLTVWAGLAVPVGTPQEAIDYLEKASLEAAGNPELQKQLRSAGMDPAAIPAADFGKTWKADYAWIAKAAAEAKPNLTN